MTQDEYNDLVNTVQQLTEKTDTLADSIARVDTKVENTKYLTRLLDVSVQYPAENDVLVYDKTGKWKNAQYDEIGLQPGEGGESNVYVIGIGDGTSPTNENVYSAARTIEDWVSSKNDDVVEGSLTFNEGKTIYIDNIQSRNASEGTDLGSGFICKIKSSGKSYIEVDDLAVRGAAMFNTLEIKKITSIGGNLVISPASNNIIRVEETTQLYEDEYQSVYRCYFRNKDEKDGGNTEQIKTDFQAGDLAKIQQFNVAEGVNEGAKNRYYWGKVLGVGEDYIDLSKTDVDPSTNTQPVEGDTLIQYGNKNDVKRQNIISLTTYADNAPAIQMYQGINGYSTDGKAIIEMAYDTAQSQQQAYMNVYGRMYVGTKDKSTSYVKYDPTEDDGKGLLTVKAKLIVESDDGDVTLIEGGKIKTNLIDVDKVIADIGIWTNQIQVGNNFTVTSDGTMTAKNANITGVVNATSGTFSNVTINSGNIGAFNISGSLSSGSNGSGNYMRLSSSSLYFRSNIGNRDIRASFGADGSGVLPGSSGMSMPIGIYRNISNSSATWDENVGLFISCNGGRKYGNVAYSGNIAINIESGFIRGLRFNVKTTYNLQSGEKDSEGYYNMTDADTFVYVTNDSITGVNLPTNPQEGQMYIVRKGNYHGVIYVRAKGNTTICINEGASDGDFATQVQFGGREAGFFVYSEVLTQGSGKKGIWYFNYFG